MRKFLIYALLVVIVGISGFMAFVYYVPFSEGFRSGELIKFSERGVMIKTWEGQLSSGVAQESHFYFSVLDSEEEVIKQLKELQGQRVRLTYSERYRTFAWWGDTRYFITNVEQVNPQSTTNMQPSNAYNPQTGQQVGNANNNAAQNPQNCDFQQLKEENQRLKERVDRLEKEFYELKFGKE